jgi:hypothetical protein
MTSVQPDILPFDPTDRQFIAAPHEALNALPEATPLLYDERLNRCLARRCPTMHLVEEPTSVPAFVIRSFEAVQVELG